MTSICIIEDEPHLCAQLERYIGELPDMKVVSASAAVVASTALIDQHKPDIILSDIKLLDGDAFDVLTNITHKPYALVFITAYDEFALKAIKFGAFDYLLKPLSKTELHATLLRIAAGKTIPAENDALQNSNEQYKTGNAPRLVIRTINVTYFLVVADIIYCSSVGNYTTFVMKDGEKVMATKNIKEYEMLLPSDIFIRTHQSYIVNTRFIKQLRNDGTLGLTHCSDLIPVSTRKKEMVLQFLSK